MFNKHPKNLIYSSIILLAFLILFFQPKVFSPFKMALIRANSLPLRIISFPFIELKKILTYHKTYNEYLRYKKEVNTLKARFIGLDEVLRENTRLEQLLEFKRKLIFSSVAANVISRDPSNWNASIVIDKGSDDGLAEGLPIVSALGVVGKVTEVSPHIAKAILVTDPGFSVAALVKRSREVGLVSGTLSGMCRMRYLSGDADVEEGDQVMTSKLSAAFPEGLLIGEVVEVRSRAHDPVIDCIVQPAVNLSQLEEVLVILTGQQ